MSTDTQETPTAVHTPTPWFLSARSPYPGYRYAIRPDSKGHGWDLAHVCNHDDADANAAFIVRACNSHEALVRDISDAINEIEFCRAVLKDYARGVRHDTEQALRRITVAGQVADNCRAALKLATEG